MDELLSQYSDFFAIIVFGGWILWMFQFVLYVVGG